MERWAVLECPQETSGQSSPPLPPFPPSPIIPPLIGPLPAAHPFWPKSASNLNWLHFKLPLLALSLSLYDLSHCHFLLFLFRIYLHSPPLPSFSALVWSFPPPSFLLFHSRLLWVRETAVQKQLLSALLSVWERKRNSKCVRPPIKHPHLLTATRVSSHHCRVILHRHGLKSLAS